MKRSYSGIIAVVVIAAGCTEINAPCPADPARVVLSPRTKEVTVGEMFTPTVTALICHGSSRTAFVGAWRSGNSQVVSVDSSSGMSRAISRGTTTIYAQYRSRPELPYGSTDSVVVTVR